MRDDPEGPDDDGPARPLPTFDHPIIDDREPVNIGPVKGFEGRETTTSDGDSVAIITIHGLFDSVNMKFDDPERAEDLIDMAVDVSIMVDARPGQTDGVDD